MATYSLAMTVKTHLLWHALYIKRLIMSTSVSNEGPPSQKKVNGHCHSNSCKLNVHLKKCEGHTNAMLKVNKSTSFTLCFY